MALSTFDDYLAATKQMVIQKKTASITTVAQIMSSPFNLAGTPGAGTLAGTSTTAGVVPTDATAGCPTINAFGGSGVGKITRLNAYCSVSGQLMLADMLWKGGAYPYNAAVTLADQPSFSTRVPSGTDFTGCEIWLEQVTAMTGNQSIRIQYTDGANASQDTGTIATGVAPIVGRMFRLPMPGGNGVKRIDVVTSTVSTAGTFNVLVLRPLALVRIPFAGYSEQRDMFGTGAPLVYADSALVCFCRPDSTALGLPEFDIEIASN
jgi:hypothetical protein